MTAPRSASAGHANPTPILAVTSIGPPRGPTRGAVAATSPPAPRPAGGSPPPPPARPDPPPPPPPRPAAGRAQGPAGRGRGTGDPGGGVGQEAEPGYGSRAAASRRRRIHQLEQRVVVELLADRLGGDVAAHRGDGESRPAGLPQARAV